MAGPSPGGERGPAGDCGHEAEEHGHDKTAAVGVVAGMGDELAHRKERDERRHPHRVVAAPESHPSTVAADGGANWRGSTYGRSPASWTCIGSDDLVAMPQTTPGHDETPVSDGDAASLVAALRATS
jgi:hypothetical protein